MKSTEFFTGLEDKYQKYRPSYPSQALDSLYGFVEAGRSGSWPSVPNLIDVGAGTGILTRQLRDRFGSAFRYVAVEPNDAMRRRAEAETDPGFGIAYVNGTAEAIPAPSGSCALVIAAQAAHWFDRPRFYAEAARLLAPGGTLALLYNDRDWRRDAFMAAYEDFLEAGNPKYSRPPLVPGADSAGRPAMRSALDGELQQLKQFGNFQSLRFEWQLSMSEDAFIGMCLSLVVCRRAIGDVDEPEAIDTLRRLIAGHYDRGAEIVVHYSTHLLAVRRGRNV